MREIARDVCLRRGNSRNCAITRKIALFRARIRVPAKGAIRRNLAGYMYMWLVRPHQCTTAALPVMYGHIQCTYVGECPSPSRTYLDWHSDEKVLCSLQQGRVGAVHLHKVGTVVGRLLQDHQHTHSHVWETQHTHSHTLTRVGNTTHTLTQHTLTCVGNTTHTLTQHTLTCVGNTTHTLTQHTLTQHTLTCVGNTIL